MIGLRPDIVVRLVVRSEIVRLTTQHSNPHPHSAALAGLSVTESTKKHADFFDLARLHQQLELDREYSLQTLQERDVAIGQKITVQTPVTRLLRWLHLVEKQNAGKKGQGPADSSPISAWISFGLIIFGLLAGVSSMLGVLLVNHQQPVNILVFLSLFIVLQLILLLITIASAFFPFQQHRFSSPLVLFNPAAMLFKYGLRHSPASLALNNIPWSKVPLLTRYALLRWGQILGISFNTALIMTLLICLAMSDRSFAWSSTLSISEAVLHNVLTALSVPWSWFVESASVNAELIKTTRIQSLQTQFDSSQVSAMRQWWPFLFASLLVYGLLPRLVLFIGFNFLLKRGVQQAFINYPGAALVLNRLSAPRVNTYDHNSSEEKSLVTSNTDSGQAPARSRFTLINWAKTLTEKNTVDFGSLGLDIDSQITAGIDLSEDKNIIANLNRQAAQAILIAVKSWEPPLAELNDFLDSLNQNIEVYLLLVPLADRSISDNEWTDWQHFAKQASRAHLQVLRTDSLVRPS